VHVKAKKPDFSRKADEEEMMKSKKKKNKPPLAPIKEETLMLDGTPAPPADAKTQ
jgi:hypothetical protein